MPSSSVAVMAPVRQNFAQIRERVSDAANLLLTVLETAVKQASTDRVHG